MGPSCGRLAIEKYVNKLIKISLRSIGKTKLHLGILLGAENITEQWSDQSVLPAVNLIMNTTINLEVNAIPMQLRYGTLASTAYDKLSNNGILSIPASATDLIQQSDANLQTLTRKSIEYQQLIKSNRRKKGLNRAGGMYKDTSIL